MNELELLRFSRQILLQEVGVEGQRRIFQTAVRLWGGGEALAAAAAYLGAGGSDVRMDAGEISGRGFLWGLLPLAAFNAGPAAAPLDVSSLVELGEFPARPTGDGPWVGIGGAQGHAVILTRSSEGCRDCFFRTAASLTESIPVELSTAAGSLAALCVQRRVLGWETQALRALAVGDGGVLQDHPLLYCKVHLSGLR